MSRVLTFVTGNKNKLAEVVACWPVKHVRLRQSSGTPIPLQLKKLMVVTGCVPFLTMKCQSIRVPLAVKFQRRNAPMLHRRLLLVFLLLLTD